MKITQFFKNNAMVVSGVASALFSASTLAATTPVNYFTATALQPIADALSTTIGTVVAVAIGVMAVGLTAKVGMGIVKSFIAKASS